MKTYPKDATLVLVWFFPGWWMGNLFICTSING